MEFFLAKKLKNFLNLGKKSAILKNLTNIFLKIFYKNRPWYKHYKKTKKLHGYDITFSSILQNHQHNQSNLYKHQVYLTHLKH